MPIKAKISTEGQKRHGLLSAIESERDSKIVTYFLSDRPAAQAQIAEDSVRPMYDHLRAIGPTRKVDLFLYSVGGHVEVPWRIVTMIRQFAEEFDVLIPYKAMSAATLIALGADRIVMGRKGELGPIDPHLSIQRGKEGETAVQEEIAVEDIISYVRFLREKAGLSDQAALAGPVSALTEKLPPWVLGGLNRAHSHIRLIARKLLTARSKQQLPDEQQIQVIIDTLAEKTYQHGHAIGRQEAEDIGLRIDTPSDGLENMMWELFEKYESLAKLRQPIDPRTFLPPGEDERTERLIMGCIESLALADHFTGDLKVRGKRQAVPQLALNLNMNLQLPPGIQPDQLPVAAQQAVQQIMQQFQQQAQNVIQQELRNQMPIVEFNGWLQDGAWRRVEDWPRSG